MSTGMLLGDMRFTLYDWAPSPFCLKVRALLDYKKITYTRVPALGRPLYDMWRRGGTGKLPALDVDGELVCDSTEIAHVVERRAPDPPVLPPEKRERALCHALEDWADEALYFVGLYFHWWHPEGRARTPKAFGKSPLGRAVFLA